MNILTNAYSLSSYVGRTILPNEPAMNDAVISPAVGIAGVINEMPCYNSGSPLGLRPSLVVNVRLLP